ncbi:MAG: c-type cytochrome [Henriciella sp.]
MRNASLMTAIWPLSLLGLAACGNAENATQDSSLDQSTDRAAVLALACSGCHSDRSGAIASLTGYPSDLMRDSLLAYKTDPNGTTVMHRLARGYSDADIELISAYLGAEDAS